MRRQRGSNRRQPLAKRIAHPQALWSAWSKVSSGTGMPGVDAVTPRSFSRNASQQLDQLSADLRSGAYSPSPLRTFERTTAGKTREFAMPTVRDRVAQRAALDAVGRVLDKQQMGSSFAYRKGRSWLDALHRVERHRDAGFQWIYRCDIRDFFGSVDHEVLRVVLGCILSRNADVDLVMRWVTTPRIGPNGMQPGTKGLPLGLPLSGALANAYLTPFDLSVSGTDRHSVRYADDTVVCCRTQEDARRVQLDCEQALVDLRLQTHPAKSYVSNFDRGFSFLGWTFFGDHGFQSDQERSWVHPLTYGR